MENKSKRILIKEGINKDINISNLFDVDQINITVSKDAKLNLTIALLSEYNDTRIKINVKENAEANIYVADFSNSSARLTALVKLEGEGAKGLWKTSCLSKNEEEKYYDISFIHEVKNTSSEMINYGVATDSSSLTFKGISHIQNNAAKSSANQQAKIIVFDDEVKASSSPSLRIDNNDINASHSAIVGRLNEDHLYYLMSRGLSEDESRRLITYGYLSPIAEYFDDETKEEILKKISVRF